MSKYFNKEITLESTAREMGVHYVHLSRIFKKKSGYSFTWYLNLMKFSYAERLLRTTDKTITEISYESGFGSLRNFNRIFSGITDMTPTEYKKKKKEHKW